jgi:molecular chaperone GrpE
MSEQDFPPIDIVEDEPLPASEPTAHSLGLDLPEDPREMVPILLQKLAEARSEADSYLDDLRRVAADFENYRRRSQRELAALIERAAERVIRELLAVLDSFDAALAIEAQTETEEKMLGGMRSTHSQLLDALAREGLEVIPTWMESFDPSIHQAVTAAGGGEGSLMVKDELRRGYRLRGKLLRAALVSVENEQHP